MDRPFELSKHAVQRALEMGLEAEFIRRVVLNPTTRRQDKSKYGDQYMVHTYSGVAAVVGPDNGVVTFLKTDEGVWSR